MELIIFARRVILVLASRMLACDNDTLPRFVCILATSTFSRAPQSSKVNQNFSHKTGKTGGTARMLSADIASKCCGLLTNINQ